MLLPAFDMVYFGNKGGEKGCIHWLKQWAWSPTVFGTGFWAIRSFLMGGIPINSSFRASFPWLSPPSFSDFLVRKCFYLILLMAGFDYLFFQKKNISCFRRSWGCFQIMSRESLDGFTHRSADIRAFPPLAPPPLPTSRPLTHPPFPFGRHFCEPHAKLS